jgi:hypothetical protein
MAAGGPALKTPSTAGRSATAGRPATPGGSVTSRGWPWLAGAVTTALILVALTDVEPALSIGLLGGVAGVLLATLRPKAFMLLAALLIVFSSLLRNVLGPAGGLVDEGVIALAVVLMPARRLMTEGRLVWLPGSAWFAGFLFLGLLSSFAADVPLGIVLPAAFVALKGVMFAFALAQVRWRRDDLVWLVRVGIALVVAMAATGLLNILAPASWARFTTGAPPVNYLGSIPAINGIFQHPAAFSRFCGVLAVACLVYGLVVRRSAANFLLVAISGGLAFLTLQVKSIVGLLATLAVLGARFVRPAGIAALLCLGPIAAVIILPPLVQLLGADFEIYVLQDSARSRLTEGGAIVAGQYFPLGAGFGRYGSSTAASSYSPLYYLLGFSDRYGMAPDSSQFLNDTQWPAIYGETGWIGAFCFAAGLAAMLVCLLRRTSATEDPLVRWIRITGVGWMILLLVESAAAPVFVSSPSFPFVFAAAGIVASFRSDARDRRRLDDAVDAGRPLGPRLRRLPNGRR